MKTPKQLVASAKLACLLLIITAVLDAGCKKDNSTPASPGTNEVWMQNTAFTPSTLTVSVNTTVKWTNKDGMAHTVTSNSGLFDSGNIGSNGTYSHQFNATGTFPYHCAIHVGMSGQVIVQ